MSRQFRPTSVPNELSFSRDPRVERGNIQREIPPGEPLAEIANIPETENYKNGYKLIPLTEESFNSVKPNCATGKDADFKVLCLMELKGKNAEGERQTWRRAALLNKKTGNITLIGSTNKPGGSYIKSYADGWGILRSRVFAPVYFWKEVENRLRYGV